MEDKASGWNPFLISLLGLSEELEVLGIVYVDGNATYLELRES